MEDSPGRLDPVGRADRPLFPSRGPKREQRRRGSLQQLQGRDSCRRPPGQRPLHRPGQEREPGSKPDSRPCQGLRRRPAANHHQLFPGIESASGCRPADGQQLQRQGQPQGAAGSCHRLLPQHHPAQTGPGPPDDLRLHHRRAAGLRGRSRQAVQGRQVGENRRRDQDVRRHPGRLSGETGGADRTETHPGPHRRRRRQHELRNVRLGHSRRSAIRGIHLHHQHQQQRILRDVAAQAGQAAEAPGRGHRRQSLLPAQDRRPGP